MFRIRLSIVLISIMMMAFVPGSPAAQYNRDTGEYVILSAQYGTARRHVDVTDRLKELASRDLKIRIDNNTFRTDPDPNQVKTLRVFARGPNGGEQMFEYREGGTVDGSKFRGWGRGDWGTGGWSGNWEGGGNNRDNRDVGNRDSGDYVILSAQ